MYALILITLAWSDYTSAAAGTTTTKLNGNMTEAQCVAAAVNTTRTIQLTQKRNVTATAICVKES